MFGLGRLWLVLTLLKNFFVHRGTRYVLAWLVALGVTTCVVIVGWNYFATDPERPDGNDGHTSIDFGGQWIMGRMLVLGQGRFLYERNHLRTVLRDNYPLTDENPKIREQRDGRGDAETLLYLFMGSDKLETATTFASCGTPLAGPDALGAVLLTAGGILEAWPPERMEEAAARNPSGPLYPPINAFVCAPLALFPPLIAYHIHQVVDVGLILLAAWGVSRLSSGHIWVPVALTLLVLYPGFHGGHLLAQNSALTLTILVWGWAFLVHGRPGWGGAVWGLLAFKPVWALSFFLVLLLSRRWRACLTMSGMGVAQIALTLPFVGLESWREWLQLGREAAALYNVDYRWIYLSRDLLGIPRRFMLNFTLPSKERDVLAAGLVGWALLLGAAEITVRLAVLRTRQIQAVTGPGAAFLLLGGWLCCYHFMYYDVLLTFLPVMLLFTEPSRLFQRDFWQRLFPEWELRALHPWAVLRRRHTAGAARFTTGAVALLRLPSSSAYGWIANPFPLLALVTLLAIENPIRVFNFSDQGPPLNTYALILLWFWCGWRVLGQGPAEAQAPQPRAKECTPTEMADMMPEAMDGQPVRAVAKIR